MREETHPTFPPPCLGHQMVGFLVSFICLSTVDPTFSKIPDRLHGVKPECNRDGAPGELEPVDVGDPLDVDRQRGPAQHVAAAVEQARRCGQQDAVGHLHGRRYGRRHIRKRCRAQSH